MCKIMVVFAWSGVGEGGYVRVERGGVGGMENDNRRVYFLANLFCST